jgi:putative ABC transport system ATP-binding protein
MVKLNKDFNTTFIFASHDEKVIGYLRRQISLDDGKVVSDLRIDAPLHSTTTAEKDLGERR